jgi:hypothetical protein
MPRSVLATLSHCQATRETCPSSVSCIDSTLLIDPSGIHEAPEPNSPESFSVRECVGRRSHPQLHPISRCQGRLAWLTLDASGTRAAPVARAGAGRRTDAGPYAAAQPQDVAPRGVPTSGPSRSAGQRLEPLVRQPAVGAVYLAGRPRGRGPRYHTDHELEFVDGEVRRQVPAGYAGGGDPADETDWLIQVSTASPADEVHSRPCVDPVPPRFPSCFHLPCPN